MCIVKRMLLSALLNYIKNKKMIAIADSGSTKTDWVILDSDLNEVLEQVQSDLIRIL